MPRSSASTSTLIPLPRRHTTSSASAIPDESMTRPVTAPARIMTTLIEVGRACADVENRRLPLDEARLRRDHLIAPWAKTGQMEHAIRIGVGRNGLRPRGRDVRAPYGIRVANHDTAGDDGGGDGPDGERASTKRSSHDDAARE